MSDLTTLMTAAGFMTPTSGALLVLGLLMALRVVRALQKPVSSRQAFGSRTRPNGVRRCSAVARLPGAQRVVAQAYVVFDQSG